MRWLLDTNACIRFLNGRSLPLKQRIEAADERELAVCSVVKAELFYGAARSKDPAATLEHQRSFLSRFVSFVFDDHCAEAYGTIRGHLSTRGLSVGPNDLLIASIAVTNRLTLITHNVTEFSRVPDLRIEDWES